MTKIEIRTQNIAGDEELHDALLRIAEQVAEGEVAGTFSHFGEEYTFAINPTEPLIED